ncbi:branched-chain amino acid transport system substrate-binding protein [Pseudochelatococcus lubricantis]|uniref:Branched-chain amino acid transport system substrate-binding protein n=1 Tax=Pseudochelatococcus lubricantis TaxID=1538102 RepID=A0ABX0UTR0_9HYPH|nr:ABC transporter substrate-binding protein [Pseudochelatococcus lubricantis]NIJ56356.1 branched-chain amino acid transport system substrate-binding protein [Pseudochelatococcus lubricantis]
MRKWALAGLAMQMALGMGASQAAEEVKIGVMTDLSGPDSDMAGAGSVLAAQMAVEDAGGVAGSRKVVLISADHQRKPDVASSLATRWYDNEGVDLILDVPLSSAGLAVQEIARQRGKVVIFATSATSDLTGKACSPTGFHWVYDTKAVANGTAAAVTRDGGKDWFFVTSDYAFGHAIERDATAVIEANGGKVTGRVRHPVSNGDFSSFLLQAQSSKASVIGLANSANDLTGSLRQASEFGIAQGGQRVAALLAFITDVHSLGLPVAQGTFLTESFYWDLDDETREWSARFAQRHNGAKPTMIQAGIYSATRHYLKAVAAADSKDGPTVAAKMREIPVNDFMTKDAQIWPSGWVNRDFYLFKVKSPEESKGPWDYYTLVAKVPADVAKPAGSDDACELMKKGG